ncbi:hypothetical protein BKA57DRAFT_165462 [Linnemannia elongata]|nr:hypothetical protein BKA57DRAFT_165462 [Linnemannia elongata]
MKKTCTLVFRCTCPLVAARLLCLSVRFVSLSLYPVTNALQAAGRMLIFEGAVVNNYAFYEDSSIECMSDGVGS